METEHMRVRLHHRETCAHSMYTRMYIMYKKVSFSFLKETASFDKLHVCFSPLLMLELTVLGQFPVIALSKEYYYRELIASCQSHRKSVVRK